MARAYSSPRKISSASASRRMMKTQLWPATVSRISITATRTISPTSRWPASGRPCGRPGVLVDIVVDRHGHRPESAHRIAHEEPEGARFRPVVAAHADARIGAGGAGDPGHRGHAVGVGEHVPLGPAGGEGAGQRAPRLF